MIYLSKSKYCGLWQCPKIAWLKENKPEELELDRSVLSRMEAGNEVGDLAMGLFGDFVEVTAYNNERLDLSKMIENTKSEMGKGTPVICEASFDYNGLYCAVDILKKEDNGWAIYEVKSSTKHEDTQDDKQVYIADVAYQKYILENVSSNSNGQPIISPRIAPYIFHSSILFLFRFTKRNIKLFCINLLGKIICQFFTG